MVWGIQYATISRLEWFRLGFAGIYAKESLKVSAKAGWRSLTSELLLQAASAGHRERLHKLLELDRSVLKMLRVEGGREVGGRKIS